MFVLSSSFSSLFALFLVLFSPVRVVAFTFTPGTPSECGNLPISWTGGTPPFELLLTPVFSVQQNISIPPTAFNNGVGSFSMQLQMSATSKFILTMSDATGFNSGGTTPLLTVGTSVGGSSCNTTSPQIPFTFDLNDALTQCIPFGFTGFTGAIQPVTIFAFIPGGTAFELNPPVGSTSYSWTADVIHGTSMMFSMIDAQGRPGGSSDIKTVGLSDDSSCLSNQSPSSTSGAPSPTASSSSTSTSGSTSPAAPSHGISIAAIAGTVIAALLFLAVIITLGLFFLRKRRDSQTPSNDRRLRRSLQSEFDLSDPGHAPVVTPYVPQNYNSNMAPQPYYPNANDANPFAGQPVTDYQMPLQHQHSGSFHSSLQHYPLLHGYPPEIPITDSSAPSLSRIEFEPPPGQSASRDSTSTSQRKGAIAGVTPNKPARFVLHTDAEDVPQPDDDEVVELPPQYSERQRTIRLANYTPDSNTTHLPGRFS